MKPTTRALRARRVVSVAAVALAAASPVSAAPSEGCTKGPAEALRAGDAEAAEDALRRALADSACGPVAPELRLRLAQVLAENHGGKPGPACEAMGLYHRIAAESDDALVQSDAAARAERLMAVCTGEAPKVTPEAPAEPKTDAPAGAVAEEPAPGARLDAPVVPAPEPGPREWALVAGCGGMMAVGGVLVAVSQLQLAERDQAYRDYLAAPFGSSAEQAAADRFDDAQTRAQVLVGTGIASIAVGAVLGIIAVGVWPEGSAEADGAAAPAARLLVGPTGVGLAGSW